MLDAGDVPLVLDRIDRAALPSARPADSIHGRSTL
jgi:hypothetical protein